MKAAAIVASALFCIVGAADVARSASEEEPMFALLINRERASRNLEPLAADEELLVVARRHAERMAQAGRLFHNPNLPNEVSGWRILGENVGVGDRVDVIHDAFMNSPIHQAEILGPEYRGFAVGTFVSGDHVWVTELFVLRAQPLVAGERFTSPPQQQPEAPDRLPVSSVSRPAAVELPASLRFTIEEQRATLSLVALALLLVSIDGHLLRLARSRR